MIVIVMEERKEASNDYVLPEKWCVDVTDENRDIINCMGRYLL